MKKQGLSASLMLLLVLGIMLAGCQSGAADTGGETEGGSSSEEQPTAEPSGGDAGSGGGESDAGLQEPISADIVLDPALAADEESSQINALLYDRLVTVDSAGNPQPALAISWVISEDGLSYTFQLRPGVAFSSGAPLDADAVIANFDRWFDPASPLRGSGSYDLWKATFLGFAGETNEDGTSLSVFDGIEKVNNLTVLIHLNRADFALLEALARVEFSIADPSVLASAGDSYGTSADTVSGTGAYVIEEWTGSSLTLAPNEAYWGAVPQTVLEYPLE